MKTILAVALIALSSSAYATTHADFSSYCTKTVAEATSASELKTIAVLSKLVNAVNPTTAEDCQALEVALESQKSFFLKKKDITSLKPLSYLSHAEQINAMGNSISDLEGLDGLKNLIYLDVSDNEISKLDGIESLLALKEVRLGKNKITDLSNLGKLPSLETVSLQSNGLNSVEGLYSSHSIRYINLTSNSVVSLGGIEQIKSLETLIITSNAICDLPTLKATLPETVKLLGAESQKCESTK